MIASDSELLGRHLYGDDSDAFEELIRRHSTMVMNVCRNMLLRKEDAEDAFQATFLVLARKATSIAERNTIAGWLYHVAVRNCLEVRRLHSRRNEENVIEDPVCTEHEPWLSISNAQESELIHKEINKLPKLYREVIVLCHIQGRNRSETAELLDTTVASVKAALSRGRNLLRKRLVRRGVMTTALVAAISASTTSASAAVSENLIQQTMATCTDSALASSHTSTFIQNIAQNGAQNMNSTSLLTKSIFAFATVALICVPLVVIAQSTRTGGETNSTVVEPTDNQKTIEEKPVKIAQNKFEEKAEEKNEETSAPSSEEQDPREFDINHSLEYWKLIKQSLEVKQRQAEEDYHRTKLAIERGMNLGREKSELLSRSFELQAKILEAELNIQRIKFEQKSGPVIDPRKVPAASTTAIRPGDVLVIRSLSDETISLDRVVVQADRTINLPFVGLVSLDGMTPSQAEEMLNVKYVGYLNNADIFVQRLSEFDASNTRHSAEK
ncbi:MAG: sigma-70 family RNA polymerase sigma factor [Planctomycetota bacterium]